MLSRFVSKTVRVPMLASTQQIRTFAERGQSAGDFGSTLGMRRLTLDPNAPVLTILPNKEVVSCAELMALAKVGSFVVCDEQKIVKGIVTERDILRCLGSSFDRLKNGNMKVKDIMTPANRLICVSEFDTRANILKTMNDAGIRHILLQNQHSISGCVSIRDMVADLINNPEAAAFLAKPRN